MESEVPTNSVRRLTFKNFVAEGNPLLDSIVSLKSHTGGKSLHLFLSGINDVLALTPVMFKLLNNVKSEGVDDEIFVQEVKKYDNKKVVVALKRFRNKTSVCVQLLFDENNTGVYKHTQCQVTLSPEDDLEKLREFAQALKKGHTSPMTPPQSPQSPPITSVEGALKGESEENEEMGD